MLKNPTFSLFGQVVPVWLQSGTQQYRFCGDLLLFIAKTSTKNNNNLNYTAHASVSYILFILIRLDFMFSCRGFPESSAIMNSVYADSKTSFVRIAFYLLLDYKTFSYKDLEHSYLFNYYQQKETMFSAENEFTIKLKLMFVLSFVFIVSILKGSLCLGWLMLLFN